jgi:hypothetical protein
MITRTVHIHAIMVGVIVRGTSSHDELFTYSCASSEGHRDAVGCKPHCGLLAISCQSEE